jgi:hypothetical protein
MFTRRFVLLAVVLAALNVVLWLAAPGFALRKAVVKELFGPRMMRAEVIQKDGADWRLDRGVIVSVTSSQLVLREADGKVQPIAISASTKVIRLGRHLPLSALARGWHVLVTWPSLSGPAQSVDVERIPRVSVR